MRKRICLFAVLVLVLSFAAVSVQAAPLWESDVSETVTQGVMLRKLDRFYQNTWDRVRVLYVDLTNKNLDLRVMTAKQGISYRETTLSMAQRYGAVAAVNADFFNMTNAPTNMLGVVMQDGVMQSTPSADAGLAAFALTEDGNVLMDYFSFSGEIVSPDGYKSELFAVNKVPVTTGGVTMLTPAWGEKSTGMLKDIAMTEMVVTDGIVTEIRVGQDEVSIPENGYVLVTNGAINGFLAETFAVGDAVEISTELRPKTDAIREATGGGTILVKDGKIAEFTHNVSGYAQRTAIGIDKSGETLMLVTVDGRMAECEGMNQTEFAKLLIELGCDTALNLDGGGSTTMVSRDRFSGKLAEQNTLITSMRAVSTAIGIFEDAPSGSASGVAVRLSSDVVNCGDAVRVEYAFYDKYHNPVSVAASKVKITSDRPATVKDNAVTPKEGGTYEITVSYGKIQQKVQFTSVAEYADIYLSVQEKQIKTGENYTFALRATDASGHRVTIPAEQVEWQVDSDAFSVKNGKVTATGSGSGFLRADFAGMTAYASVATADEILYNKPNDVGEEHPDYGEGNGYEILISGHSYGEDTLLRRLQNEMRIQKLQEATNVAYRLGSYAGDAENILSVTGFSAKSINNNLLLTVNNVNGGIKNTDAKQWAQLIDAVKGATEKCIVLLMPKSVYGLEDGEKRVLDDVLGQAAIKGKKVYVVYEGSETEYAVENGVTYLVCGAMKNAHTKTFFADEERFACLKLTLTLHGVKFTFKN